MIKNCHFPLILMCISLFFFMYRYPLYGRVYESLKAKVGGSGVGSGSGRVAVVPLDRGGRDASIGTS
jgi:hypothetical protein